MVARKSWRRGTVLYTAYLAVLGLIWAAVECWGLSAAMGLGLAVLSGAGMAVFWPRW
ncbi:hypothetical protein SAMN02745133_02167 [Desulforamulus putei DSM 12395]|uniref:Uncharacterized protein n=1 Tax=Desulforamulus putei DSM 12395 TaxID=1121429 RepID=A0A1M5A4H0_9FIRM|nr:hypothetical protein SAMN02745133_02167 [Desulforamulus putei DSM 12395]